MANAVEIAARTCCANLLQSKTAQLLPTDLAEAFAISAFLLGAAWALDRPDLIAIANAQMDSMRAALDGRVS